MKQVIQLDHNGYFVGFANADESPLEAGVFLMPAGCIDAPAPSVPEEKLAKWVGEWVFEDIQLEAEQEKEVEEASYSDKRAAEYPPYADYLDGIVKGDQAQVDAYIAACQAVKAKYPKGA
jgi:hypothetical protein